MSTTDDYMLLLHAPDGSQWAEFISKRLANPNYNIRTVLRDITVKSNESLVSSTLPPQESKGSFQDKDANGNKTVQQNITKLPANSRDSGRGSDTILNDACSIKDHMNNSKANIIFLSPCTMDNNVLPFNISFLNPKRTVFLFLGVSIEEAEEYFQEDSEQVLRCKCCVLDGSEESTVTALLRMIEAYEDDEEIYQTPPSPKQLNKIEKVFPRELSWKERDVHVLLERPAEDEVFAITDSSKSQEIPLRCVCDRLYSFALPDNTNGEVFFRIESQGICFGEDSVQVISKLDCLKSILDDEVNPMALLSSALDLKTQDLNEIDTTLALRLQQLGSLMIFKTMFPCEDSLTISDEPSSVLYPSLLHFAAEYNLRAFCSELLRYPGMLGAACTENKNGDFPSSIAMKKGYIQLETDLIQFVDNCRATTCDEGLYVQASPSISAPLPPPKPHTTSTDGYVNTKYRQSGPYIMMNKPASSDCHSKSSDSEILSLVSQSSDNIFDDHTSTCKSENDDSNFESRTMRSHQSDQRSPSEASHDSSLYEDPTFSSGITSQKALKVLGVCEDDISGLEDDMPYPSQWSAFRSTGAAIRGHIVTSMIPHATRFPSASQLNPPPSRMTFSGNPEDPVFLASVAQDKKQNAMTNKIRGFFVKMTKSKRSNSEGEIVFSTSIGVKKSASSISDRSKPGRGIEHSDMTSRKKKYTLSEGQERDSGSYSDEEKDNNSTLVKQRNKSKVFKERDAPMNRRLSKRQEAAKKEKINDAPTLPKTAKRATFRSFIQDQES